MALAVVRALGEAGVPVAILGYDSRDVAQTSKYVVAQAQVPNPLHDEPAFVDALVEGRHRFGGSLLVPASDESTVAISRNKHLLGRHCLVACPEWEITERFIDKSRTYTLATAHGVPTPRTVVLASEDDLDDWAAPEHYPLLLKPAESHRFYERFKRKMAVVETPAGLRSWYRRAADADLSVRLQEIIPGDDSSVVNYNTYTLWPRRGDHLSSGYRQWGTA